MLRLDRLSVANANYHNATATGLNQALGSQRSQAAPSTFSVASGHLGQLDPGQ